MRYEGAHDDCPIDAPHEHSTTHTVQLTDEEIGILLEALDSHEYWQLSEPEYRDSGYVRDEGVTSEIEEARALAEKLEEVRRA